MTRLQAFLIALSVSFAVVAGTYAAMQTTRLGTGATTHVSATAIADQRRALKRTAVALHKALRTRPPKLPPVKHVAPPPPRVVYAPAPVAAVPATQPVAVAPPATVRSAPATHSHSSPAPGRGGEGRDGGNDD